MQDLLPFARTHRNLHRWVPAYGRDWLRHLTTPRHEGPQHLLFALCDHFEPEWGGASGAQARERAARWERSYAGFADPFRDADGRPPRHTFFFPGEQYKPEYLDSLAQIARGGFGEVELHLHHDADEAETLERNIVAYLSAYAQHGHLSRDAAGRLRYGFIHGNWCLANSRSDGRYCGVDSELRVLFETGCYADFTFPSAPDQTQPSIVNQIYWPTGDPARARSHQSGVRARVGRTRSDRVLMIQGPLSLTPRPDRWGLRIEAGALTANDPGTASRIDAWVSRGIHVEGRPEWVFVKVHTHGAPEAQARSLLGEPGRAMHRALASRYNDGTRFILHYVTAREMFNIAMAAMDGSSGNPDAFRNYLLMPSESSA